MIFSGQYLTYTEYRALGGTLAETPFNLLEFEARKQIDKRTLNRLNNVDSIPEEVKLCVYHLIDKISSYAVSLDNTSNVANETIDGYSIGYITSTQVGEIVNSKNYELDDIIRTDLFGVKVNNEHLIYLGVK